MAGQRAASRDMLQRRAAMLGAIRRFFGRRNVIEVDTPQLAPFTTPDPAILSLQVTGTATPQWRGYLQSSPEFAMKRLLAAGSGDIYQLAHVFRDGEHGRHHLHEFMLLEWYRLGYDEHALMDEVQALLGELLPALCSDPPVKLSYREAFLTTLGIDPHRADDAALTAALGAHGIDVPAGLARRAVLDLAMATQVMPALGGSAACFVHDYPADQAAMAELNPGDPPTAARFEVFVGGIELGNGFRELRDADEQRRRFEREHEFRRAHGLPLPPIDQGLLAALRHGLPACAGVALGIDRVLMLACGADDIREVVAVAYADAGDERFAPPGPDYS